MKPNGFSVQMTGVFPDSAKTLIDRLVRYFPPPPSILLVEEQDLDLFGNELFKRGYQVTRTGLFKETPDGCCANKYDGILFYGELQDGIPLASFCNRIRRLLKTDGVVAICCKSSRRDSFKENARHQPSEKLITGLYENGFSIRAREPQIIFARKTEVFLRPYCPGDETVILEMFRQVFNTPRTMDHWYWKFRDNPFGAYNIVQAIGEDGILAGHYSGYPVSFYAPARRNESFLSLQIGDIMTRPGFRHVGLGKTSVLGRITDYFHHQFCMGHVPFMYGFVAGNHRKFGERFLRYQYMPEIPYHVLNLKDKPLPEGRPFKQLLTGIRVEEIEHLPRSFDLFFKEAAMDYGLLVKRSADYVKWRYLDSPDGGYRFFVVKRFGRLLGWSVFKKQGDVLLWGDAMFLKAHVKLARTLLSEVVYGHFQTVKRIEGWFSATPPWWGRILFRMGFQATKEPNGLVGGVTLFDPSISLSFVSDNLYYTMGDSDLF